MNAESTTIFFPLLVFPLVFVSRLVDDFSLNTKKGGTGRGSPLRYNNNRSSLASLSFAYILRHLNVNEEANLWHSGDEASTWHHSR
ncbi:hypothetical protein E2C01_016728 [Portunus trituberculatus]|uniref:Uncharacterized protein n=1 Tax=Portunus trituberculatus TaxID=210409 RepID=A0A5B7DRF8_PORTR|nr:hypothetical protein [Portunus trituberculatus]